MINLGARHTLFQTQGHGGDPLPIAVMTQINRLGMPFPEASVHPFGVYELHPPADFFRRDGRHLRALEDHIHKKAVELFFYPLDFRQLLFREAFGQVPAHHLPAIADPVIKQVIQTIRQGVQYPEGNTRQQLQKKWSNWYIIMPEWVLQHSGVLPYPVQPLHERFVVGGFLQVVIKLHPHQ